MAVFKWNSNTPEKFNNGLGDFQHIGLMVSVNPLRIIHASTSTMCVTADTKIGKWKFWGWLKDVAREDILPDIPDEGGEDPMTTKASQATVTALSGYTVNLWAKASASAALVERISIGTVVDVLGDSCTWTKIKAGGKTGYMMTVFLAPVTGEDYEPDTSRTLEERITQLEERMAYLEETIAVVKTMPCGTNAP